jgi:hypothetical protein
MHGVAVGIEILDLTTSVPLDRLVEKFHIRTEALAVLMQALRSSTTLSHVGAKASLATRQPFGSLKAQSASNLTTA